MRKNTKKHMHKAYEEKHSHYHLYAPIVAIVAVTIMGMLTMASVGLNTPTGYAVMSCNTDVDCSGSDMCYKGICFNQQMLKEFRSKNNQEQADYISELQRQASGQGAGPQGETVLQSPYFQEVSNYQVLETVPTGGQQCPEFLYECHVNGVQSYKFKAHPSTCLKQENLGLVDCPNGCDKVTGQCVGSQPAAPSPATDTSEPDTGEEESYDDFFFE
ncbi:hypothetical protein HYY69_04235 [Candidatus Woesearchaeota archaeon]|nr:hypothetical protein [Candidatus Woesearchaeota archaeon]